MVTLPLAAVLSVLCVMLAMELAGAFRIAPSIWSPRSMRDQQRPTLQINALGGVGAAVEGFPHCDSGTTSDTGEGGDARVVRQAKAWVRDVVVNFRLCPFAEGVFNSERGVRYVVTPAENTDELWRAFLSEVSHLMTHDREEVGTTLLMATRCLEDLSDFNDFCGWLEETIDNDEFAFESLAEDDVLNYEKRSPHPTINLLRADMVDEFVAAGKTMGIAEHNERRLKSEGQGAVKAAFEAALALT
eukprot:jgi/Undpi1/8386/HiC_scaffold_25.g10854.m1